MQKREGGAWLWPSNTETFGSESVASDVAGLSLLWSSFGEALASRVCKIRDESAMDTEDQTLTFPNAVVLVEASEPPARLTAFRWESYRLLGQNLSRRLSQCGPWTHVSIT